MTTRFRSKHTALALAGLAVFAFASSGESAAEATPGVTASAISFNVPSPQYTYPIDLYLYVTNVGSLQTSDFSFFLECSDGQIFPVSGSVDTSSHSLMASGALPQTESGHNCTLTVSTDQAGRSVQLSNNGPFLGHTPNVHIVGSMATYSRTGGLT